MVSLLVSAVLAQTIVPLASTNRLNERPSGAAVFADGTFGWYLVWGDWVDTGTSVVWGARLPSFSSNAAITVRRSLVGAGTNPRAASDGQFIVAAWNDSIGETQLAVADAGLRFMRPPAIPQGLITLASNGSTVKVFLRGDGGVEARSFQNGQSQTVTFINADPDSFSASGHMTTDFQLAWIGDGGVVVASPAVMGTSTAQRVTAASGEPPVAASQSILSFWLSPSMTSWTTPTGGPFLASSIGGSTYAVYLDTGQVQFQMQPLVVGTPVAAADALFATAGHSGNAYIVFGLDGGLFISSQMPSNTVEVTRLAQERGPSVVAHDGGFIVVWEDWQGGSNYRAMAAALTSTGAVGLAPQAIVNATARKPRVHQADGVLRLRSRIGTAATIGEFEVTSGTFATGLQRFVLGDPNPNWAMGGGIDISFGDDLRVSGTTASVVSTAGVRCAGFDGNQFALLTATAWVTVASNGTVSAQTMANDFVESCVTSVDAGVFGFAVRGNNTTSVGLRSSPTGVELRRSQLPQTAREPMVVSLGGQTLLAVWLEGNTVRAAIQSEVSTSAFRNVATEQLFAQNLDVARSPGGDVVLVWQALNENDGRTEIRTVLLDRTLLLALTPRADGGIATDAGSTIDAGVRPDGGTGDGGSTTNDGGSATNDGGSATNDGGSTTNDGGSTTNDGGSTTNDGGSTSDGGISLKPQDFEPTCGCDAGGGFGLLALVSLWSRRRRASKST